MRIFFAFGNTVRSFDNFGHKQQFTYLGKESYQTYLGAIVSLVIVILTAIMFVIEIQSMETMDDPEIRYQSVEITKPEQLEQEPVNFEDFDQFYIGARATTVRDLPIGPEIGKLAAYVFKAVEISDDFGSYTEEKWDPVEMYDCKDVVAGFPSEPEYENYKCVDPADMTLNIFKGEVVGTEDAERDVTDRREFKIGFELCRPEAG